MQLIQEEVDGQKQAEKKTNQYVKNKASDLQAAIKKEMETVGDKDEILSLYLQKDLPALCEVLKENTADRQMTEEMLT